MASGAKFSEFDGAGKIFIGGLNKQTTMDSLRKHFGQYGKIVDHVVITDQVTRKSRGFGFVTYDDPSVVNKIFELTHVIDGKQVELKRTIPRNSGGLGDFKTKKLFVGGVPATASDEEFKDFFSKFGKVVEHEIIRSYETNKSRGFGFVEFDSENVVDDILSNGNRIDFAGVQVEIKRAEPKKPHPPAYSGHRRSRSHNDSAGRYDHSYDGNREAGGYGPASYRSFDGRSGPRFGSYGGYDAREMGNGSLGDYRGEEASLGYFSGISSYRGTYDSSSGGAYGVGYGREEGFGNYGAHMYGGSSYSSGPGRSYGADEVYGIDRGGYSGGAGRYHPYGR